MKNPGEIDADAIPEPTVAAFEQGFLLERGRAAEAGEIDRAMAGFQREEVLFGRPCG